MGIWEYQDKNCEATYDTVTSDVCIFCGHQLRKVREIELEHENCCNWRNKKHIKMCPVCGWWTVFHEYYEFKQFCDDDAIFRNYGAAASLKKLNLDDMSIPIDDITKFLLAKYNNRFLVNPQLFEETVASAFRGMGYYARTTAYQRDGGIDVILDGKDNKTIGIQVKRYKNSIRVSQIREFAGALIENDMTSGIFVTTSRFQKGVCESVANFNARGIAIELFDSNKFYDALQINQIRRKIQYEELVDTILQLKLELVYKDEGVLNNYKK